MSFKMLKREDVKVHAVVKSGDIKYVIYDVDESTGTVTIKRWGGHGDYFEEFNVNVYFLVHDYERDGDLDDLLKIY